MKCAGATIPTRTTTCVRASAATVYQAGVRGSKNDNRSTVRPATVAEPRPTTFAGNAGHGSCGCGTRGVCGDSTQRSARPAVPASPADDHPRRAVGGREREARRRLQAPLRGDDLAGSRRQPLVERDRPCAEQTLADPAEQWASRLETAASAARTSSSVHRRSQRAPVRSARRLRSSRCRTALAGCPATSTFKPGDAHALRAEHGHLDWERSSYRARPRRRHRTGRVAARA